MGPNVDVVIPARKGSKGLPNKNKLNLAGLPLVSHSIEFARTLPGNVRIFVTTDDERIAEIAEEYGVFCPSLRPRHLCQDITTMPEVLRYCHHVLSETPSGIGERILLLDPTSPIRMLESYHRAAHQLDQDRSAVGCISVSRPSFNPLWVGVQISDDQKVSRHRLTPSVYGRRQDVPAYWRIDGSLYLWRQEFVRSVRSKWLDDGLHKCVETPPLAAHSIDTHDDLVLVDSLLTCGAITLPWVQAP